ncbi:hypothetical protein M885DRAFT_504445 [Pelagophyceae sp. CCMP2097]|nr:hypothetical protein M885DRAFT_504445 [Pelagophyceae sp. CCMP2097]
MLRSLVGFACVAYAAGAAAQGSHHAALINGMQSIDELQQEISSLGVCVPRLGRRADAICDAAAAAIKAGLADSCEALQLETEVCDRLDARLRLLYERQLRSERDRALSDFRKGLDDAAAQIGDGDEAREYTRMLRVEREFCARADEASRSCWHYDETLRELRASLKLIAGGATLVRDATLKSAQKNANYFTVLKRLFGELEGAFAKRTGSDAPCQAGVAFRVPNTNINLSGGLARAKTTVQVSCVPDDVAPLLGANGFNARKVPAGDLALSYKVDLDI